MKTVRTALSLVSILLLGLGYGASQFAYFKGEPSEYAARLDQPPIRLLALILFFGALVLSFIPERTGVEE